MPRFHRQRLAAVLVLLAVVPLAHAQAPAKAPKRVALLVGINQYQKRGFIDLRWAENDVTETAAELRRLGFDRVVVMTGGSAGALRPTKANIEAQVKALVADVARDDVVLVMFCGHGQQLPTKRADGTTHDDGFFCPSDAVLNEPSTMVSLSSLTDDTLHKFGGKNLVLVDACRDGVVDLDRGGRSRGIQGRVVALPEDTAVLFSCRAGQRSEERDSLKHGVFTAGVLEALRADGSGALTWGALVDRVQNRVAEMSQSQEPIAAGAIGRLVLGMRANVPRTVPNVPTRPPVMPRVAGLEGSRAGEERDDNALKLKLVWCPPGRFRMGSPVGEPNRKDDEGPVEVTLSHGFWLGKYEVTQGQWQSVMGTTLRQQMEKAGWTFLAGEGGDHPMYYVSHDEASEYCRRLTSSERAAGRLPLDWEYRLPTEAQWEYACRAGTTTATAFDDRLDSSQANFNGYFPYNGGSQGRSLGRTTPVGSYRSNAWGLSDMHGNVWEWCFDGYEKKLRGGMDPVVGFGTSSRVRRGGCWYYGGSYCRSANRFWNSTGHRNDDLGFRVARVPARQD